MKKLGLVLAVISILFVAGGIAFNFWYPGSREGFAMTKAVIADIRRDGDNLTTVVEYTFGNMTRRRGMDYHTQLMKVGGNIYVFYDLNEPGEIQPAKIHWIGWTLIILGSAAALTNIAVAVFHKDKQAVTQ